jgi:hypothetical protein
MTILPSGPCLSSCLGPGAVQAATSTLLVLVTNHLACISIAYVHVDLVRLLVCSYLLLMPVLVVCVWSLRLYTCSAPHPASASLLSRQYFRHTKTASALLPHVGWRLNAGHIFERHVADTDKYDDAAYDVFGPVTREAKSSDKYVDCPMFVSLCHCQ